MEPQGAPELPNWGGSLALSLVSLGVVCLLAWLVLRFIAARGVGRGEGAIRVVARCGLEPRRSLYLVEAGAKRLLIGVGEGPMTTLAEWPLGGAAEVSDLPEHDVSARAIAPTSRGRFAEVLQRTLGRSR